MLGSCATLNGSDPGGIGSSRLRAHIHIASKLVAESRKLALQMVTPRPDISWGMCNAGGLRRVHRAMAASILAGQEFVRWRLLMFVKTAHLMVC